MKAWLGYLAVATAGVYFGFMAGASLASAPPGSAYGTGRGSLVPAAALGLALTLAWLLTGLVAIYLWGARKGK